MLVPRGSAPPTHSPRPPIPRRHPITAFTRRALLTAVSLAAMLCVSSAPADGHRRPARASTAALGSAFSNLRLIDYFPADAGWEQMWTDWNPTQMERDFRRIAALHANAVRITVNVPAFGFPQPRATMVSRLAATVRLAGAAGLASELTLFDGWSNYAAIEASRTWVREVLAPLHGSAQVAYVDLHNELPADTNPAALAWARSLVPYVQSIDGGIPVTVSTSISSGLAPLEALVRGLGATAPDLYDVHYYGNPADAYPILSQAKALAGAVPLFVGETGFATDPTYGGAQGLEPNEASLETFQDYYYRDIENATRALALPPAAPWILYDMPGQGNTTWGHHIGILHASGTPKMAASSLSEIFAGGPVATSFNNGFEQSTGSPAMPSIWRRWLPQYASFAIDHAVVHSGASAMRIEHAGGNHTSGCPALAVAPIAAIRPGVKYTATAWARGASTGGKSRVVLVWTDATGHYVASSASPSLPPGTTPWPPLGISTTPPAHARAVEINLQVCENPGTTWFDDVGFSASS